jgi:hypothetical protein
MYKIDSIEIDQNFLECWRSAAQHIQGMFAEEPVNWFRLQLPLMIEHFSFYYGNNLFFVDLYNIDQPQISRAPQKRFEMLIDEADGIGCVMPMKKVGKNWKPVIPGWGLQDYKTGYKIIPEDLIKKGRYRISPWEEHTLGLNIAKMKLVQDGWDIEALQSDKSVFPDIIGTKDGLKCGFIVRSSTTSKLVGERPGDLQLIAKKIRLQGMVPKFIGLTIADQTHSIFDPKFSHLREIMCRGGVTICKPFVIQNLVLN